MKQLKKSVTVLKNMAKLKLLNLLVLSLTLLGCEKSYPTYHDLNGEYVVDQVIVLWENTLTNESGDNIILSGDFSMVDPVTPLDSFKVGVTRFKITDANRTFMWGKRLTDAGNPWMYSTECVLRSDFISGEWDNLTIFFRLDESNTSRVFEVSTVGIDDFLGTLHQDVNGTRYDITYSFREVGP